jgi:hypothetical protein
MSNTIDGLELNIFTTQLNNAEISNEEQLFELLRDNILEFQDSRETYPADLEFEEDIEINDLGDLFAAEGDNYLILGHYFIYSDANYELTQKIKKIEKWEFFGWAVYEQPSDAEGNNILDFQGSGESTDEESFIILKKNGEIYTFRESLVAPIDAEEGLDEESEEILRSLSKSVFLELTK